MKKVRVVALLVATLMVLAAGVAQVAAKPPGGGGCPTPRLGCFCAEIYAPVTCDGGCTYSNACFASCAGATHCVPSGPGPVPVS